MQQVDQQISQIKATVAQDRAQVSTDTANLRQEAVSTYMSGTTGGDLESLFSSSGEQATVAGEYRSVASGETSGAIDALGVAQTHLSAQQDQLQSAQNQAQAALTQAAQARLVAQATVADQEATLSRVKGRIGALVAQRQAAEAAASHAAFLARVAAADASTGTAPPTPRRRRSPTFPSSPGRPAPWRPPRARSGCPMCGAARAPVRASTVPGLVQWAWRQAGVDLPRTAAAQYGAVAHIPLSDLQPGDLLFWGYGGISHVGMYVGGGDASTPPEPATRAHPGHLEQRPRGGRSSLTP